MKNNYSKTKKQQLYASKSFTYENNFYQFQIFNRLKFCHNNELHKHDVLFEKLL